LKNRGLKAKGPNPLSVKKKKKPTASTSSTHTATRSHESGDDNDAQDTIMTETKKKKRFRKRKRATAGSESSESAEAEDMLAEASEKVESAPIDVVHTIDESADMTDDGTVVVPSRTKPENWRRRQKRRKFVAALSGNVDTSVVVN
jgi:3',5'-cyclic AMP phosphodiesterase CpdA